MKLAISLILDILIISNFNNLSLQTKINLIIWLTVSLTYLLHFKLKQFNLQYFKELNDKTYKNYDINFLSSFETGKKILEISFIIGIIIASIIYSPIGILIGINNIFYYYKHKD